MPPACSPARSLACTSRLSIYLSSIDPSIHRGVPPNAYYPPFIHDYLPSSLCCCRRRPDSLFFVGVFVFVFVVALAVVLFCAPRCGRVSSSSLDVAVWICLSPFPFPPHTPHTPAIYWFRAPSSIILHAGNPTPTLAPRTHAHFHASCGHFFSMHAREPSFWAVRRRARAGGPRCYLSLPNICLIVISFSGLATSTFCLFFSF